MAEIKIFGYTNKISVKQGEEIDFHVYADGTDVADAKLVRLIHGDEHPDGPGFVEEEIDNDINGKWKVEKQFTQIGSFLKVNDPNNELSIEQDKITELHKRIESSNRVVTEYVGSSEALKDLSKSISEEDQPY